MKRSVFLATVEDVAQVEVAVQEPLLVHLQKETNVGFEQIVRSGVVLHEAFEVRIAALRRDKESLAEQTSARHFDTSNSFRGVYAQLLQSQGKTIGAQGFRRTKPRVVDALEPQRHFVAFHHQRQAIHLKPLHHVAFVVKHSAFGFEAAWESSYEFFYEVLVCRADVGFQLLFEFTGIVIVVVGMFKIQIVRTMNTSFVFWRDLHVVTIEARQIGVVVFWTEELVTFEIVLLALTDDRLSDDGLLAVVEHADAFVLLKIAESLHPMDEPLEGSVLEAELNEARPPGGQSVSTFVRITVPHIEEAVCNLKEREVERT